MNLFRRTRISLGLAVLAAAGLAYDAYVHLHLAARYDAIGASITQGALFRVEAAVAVLVALVLLISDSRLVWAGAALTGLGGVAAVLLYRYINVGAIGPIPNMYEPVWYGEKTLSAFAEGGVALVCLVREGIRLSGQRTAASRS